MLLTCPPTTRTRPLLRSAAPCPMRAALIAPAGVHMLAVGSYISAVATAPDATSTLPVAINVAECALRAVPKGAAALQSPVLGSYCSALVNQAAGDGA